MTYMVIFFQISFSKFKTQIQGRRMGNTTTSASEKDNSNPDAIEHFSFVDVDLIVIITTTYFFFSELKLSGVSLLISKVFYTHTIFPSFQYWNNETWWRSLQPV